MEKSFVCFAFFLVLKLGFTQTSFTELVSKTEKSVVTVSTFNAEGAPLKVGTAFFIDESGILLSNFHVFEGANTAKITTSGNKQYQVEKILSSSKEYDLIKFSISNSLNEHFPKLDVASNPPGKGEDIFVIGSPEGFGSSVSKGIVSGIRVVEGMGNIFQITAPISAGSSGSPVFNMQGKVFAIASYQYQTGQNMNFAIDLNLVNKLTSNEAFNSTIAIDKEIPNDILEAKKILESDSFFRCSIESLNRTNDFIKKFPNDFYGYFMRARTYSCAGLPYDYVNVSYNQKRGELLLLADKDFTKALLLASNKCIVYWYRGIAKYVDSKHGAYANSKLVSWDPKGAISDFNNATGLDKKVDNTFEQSRFQYIGDLKNDLNDFIGALEAYKLAIKVYPSSRKVYVVYGNIASIYYYDLKDLKNASLNIDKAFNTIDISNPTKSVDGFCEWDLLALRAKIRIDLKDLSGALADLNTLFDECDCTEANDAYNHYLKAAIIFQMDGDLNEAISSLNKAIQYSNDDLAKADYYELRSSIFHKQEKNQLALIDINKFFELAPNSKYNSWNYSSRSDIKKDLNDNIGALKDINKAIELDSKNAIFYYSKGLIVAELNDKIAAERAFDKAIELDPNHAHYYTMRGIAKYDNNKTGACADWSKAGEMGDYSAYDLIKEYCK